MKKGFGIFWVASFSLLLLASTIALPLQAFADKPETSKSPVIILFNDKVSDKQKSLVNSHGGEITRSFTIINGIAANIPDEAINALDKNPLVESVYPDLEAHIHEAQANAIIGADSVHALPNTGDGVTVAVLDTGGTPDHPMFSGKNIKCVSSYSRGPDRYCTDLHGHGTHVAGISVANGIGNLAAKGVAPDADLVSVKVLDRNGSGSFSNIIWGMEYVVNNGNPRANVINLSLGSGPVGNGGVCYNYYAPMDQAISSAIAANVAVVASAGNSGNDSNKGVGYPACNPEVIAVAATDDNHNRASFSSIGGALTHHGVSAPGVSIYSSVPATGASCCSDPSLYKNLSGTSMSAPVVSGSIALLLADDISLSPTQIFEKLSTTAVDLGSSGPDTYYGHGRINILEAINLSGVGSPPVLPTISVNDDSMNEGDSGLKDLEFTITCSGDTCNGTTVTFATQSVSATAGVDYSETSGFVTFVGVPYSATIPVAVQGDTVVEADETFIFNLECTDCIFSDSQGVGTIINDDFSTPDAPILSSDGYTHDTIDISWTIPFDGGSSILSYTYEWSDDNFSTTPESKTVSNTNSETITGLNSSTQYYIRVFATNIEGSSNYSNVVTETTSSPSVDVTIYPITEVLSRSNPPYVLRINGDGFGNNADVTITGGSGPAPEITNVVSGDTWADISITLKSGGPPRISTWTLTLTNTDNGQSGSTHIDIGP